MKKNIFVVLVLTGLAFAQEGFMCSHYYNKVVRKVNNINEYGPNLSQTAKWKLYKDLMFDTKQCISECEGGKFKYCNEVAKKIESQ